MKIPSLKFIRLFEISWFTAWVVLFLVYYFLLIFHIYIDIVIFLTFTLNIVFIISGILSFIIFLIARYTENNYFNFGRVFFSILNIVYYTLDTTGNVFIKDNLTYLWWILPWLLWLPLIFDVSTLVKQEFSWIK